MAEMHVATSGPKARELVQVVLEEFDRWAETSTPQIPPEKHGRRGRSPDPTSTSSSEVFSTPSLTSASTTTSQVTELLAFKAWGTPGVMVIVEDARGGTE